MSLRGTEDAPRLSFARYCKWRWLRFRRTWTDTRADRVPSWSKLYLRAYLNVLALVVCVLGAVFALLAAMSSPAAVAHVLGVGEGGAAGRIAAPAVLAAVVLVLPALATYRWMRPIWLDLVMVRERAIDFTGGRFNTRARESLSVIIGPLARTLNALAARMERLISAQRDLTNGISHELRTPLARTRFALEMLRDPASDEEFESALASIGQDVTELDELIDMSLTYARLEYSSLQSNLEPTPLNAWLEAQIRDAAVLYADKQVSVEIETDAQVRVPMDKRLMSYALRNLLRNAGKYAREQVAISLAIRHGNVVLAVEDDGNGVASAERERIFEAFVRLDRNTGGYGLGLAITRQVLRAHNGRIVATDPHRLPGARFEVSWPAGLR
jgi:two-component system OmpR family sensor kinase